MVLRIPVPVQVPILGTMIAHCVVCLLQVHAHKEDPVGESISQDIEFTGRALQKAAMLFPLLIGISARLAALVPTVFLGVLGIFLFVAFSKKALIISLFALLLTYIEKQKNQKPKITHIHHVGHHHSDIGPFEYESSHHTPHKLYDFPHFKKNYRKWPKSDQATWDFVGPYMDVNADSYLPQPSRRNGQSLNGPFVYSPQDSLARYIIMNTTEPTITKNSSETITPELQKFLEKTLAEEGDPR